ncbi:hypothetical protein BDI4_20019 [Burkholderia diffusa]|nr:hypothetical protein BDI4_20019 [Burkholderia diffusa]
MRRCPPFSDTPIRKPRSLAAISMRSNCSSRMHLRWSVRPPADLSISLESRLDMHPSVSFGGAAAGATRASDMLERPSRGTAREHSCAQFIRRARQAHCNLNKCPLADEKCAGRAGSLCQHANDFAVARTACGDRGPNDTAPFGFPPHGCQPRAVAAGASAFSFKIFLYAAFRLGPLFDISCPACRAGPVRASAPVNRVFTWRSSWGTWRRP